MRGEAVRLAFLVLGETVPAEQRNLACIRLGAFDKLGAGQ